MRHSCDDFAIVLGGFLSHKNFGHVQNFRELFATSWRLLGGLCEPMQTFHDSLETSSQIESHLHPSEIVALSCWSTAK